MEMRKKKHSGFTLVELIIVMGLFSIVMYSALQLMTPVSKYFVRSSNYESSTACVDNMKRAIEGNLKYADRVSCYANYKPYNGNSHSSNAADYPPSSVLLEQVNMFWTDYFMNRQYIDYKGKIYVMVFDNTVYEPNPHQAAYPTLKTFTDAKLNAGQILLYEFNFGKTEGYLANTASTLSPGKMYYKYFNGGATSVGSGDGQYTVTPWYVNQKMYGNYEYQFSLGSCANASSTENGILIGNCLLVLATLPHWQHFPLPLRRATEDKLIRANGFMGCSLRSLCRINQVFDRFYHLQIRYVFGKWSLTAIPLPLLRQLLRHLQGFYDLRTICPILFRMPVCKRIPYGFGKNLRLELAPCPQHMQVVEIAQPSIRRAPRQNGLQLLRDNRLDRIRQKRDVRTAVQNLRKLPFLGPWRDLVPECHVNRNRQPYRANGRHKPNRVSAVIIILADFVCANRLCLELNTVANLNRRDFGDHSFNRRHIRLHANDRGVDIHCSAVGNTENRAHQRTALYD